MTETFKNVMSLPGPEPGHPAQNLHKADISLLRRGVVCELDRMDRQIAAFCGGAAEDDPKAK